MGARVIIVSNRVALPEEAHSSLADEMAVTVKAALKNQNGMWFGWSGKVTDQPASEPRTLEVNKVTYVQIELSNNDIQEYCNGLANSVLWPILHYRVDLQKYSRADASGYMRVNRLFADHLSALMNEDDVVWVHDYHLMLLARELRSRGHRNRIGFFLHTPCAPPDILQTLPHHREILGGLTYCDLVGFQTENDRDNFAHYLVGRAGRRGAMATRSTAGGSGSAPFRSASKRRRTCALRAMRGARRCLLSCAKVSAEAGSCSASIGWTVRKAFRNGSRRSSDSWR